MNDAVAVLDAMCFSAYSKRDPYRFIDSVGASGGESTPIFIAAVESIQQDIKIMCDPDFVTSRKMFTALLYLHLNPGSDWRERQAEQEDLILAHHPPMNSYGK